MSPAIIVYYLNEKNYTRYPLSIHFDSKNARKMAKFD